MTPEKTPEQLIEEMKLQPWRFVKDKPEPPDFHTTALLAAQTIPNQTVGELLASADKIEAWLRKPNMHEYSMSVQIQPGSHIFCQQKSPEKNPEASDGVSGD